jgi:hypothetical protein
MTFWLGQQVGAVHLDHSDSGVHGDHEVLARLVPGGGDGLHDELQGVLVALEVGGEAALVAHGGGAALGGDDLFQAVEDLGAHPQALAEGGGSHRHDHELLNVHVVGGVGPAVEDIHHGHRQGLGVDAAR